MVLISENIIIFYFTLVSVPDKIDIVLLKDMYLKILISPRKMDTPAQFWNILDHPARSEKSVNTSGSANNPFSMYDAW